MEGEREGSGERDGVVMVAALSCSTAAPHHLSRSST